MSSERQIKKNYTSEELIRLFVKHLDDDLFRAVGVKHMTVHEQRNSKPHAAVWIGYEKLLGVNENKR